MSQQLVTSILFGGILSLEWEESTLPENSARLHGETLLLNIYRKDKSRQRAKWLVALGLSDPSVRYSPPLEFWRAFSSRWIHWIRTTPECDEKREAFQSVLSGEETADFLANMPPMVGIDYATAGFLTSVWDGLHETFRVGIRGFKGSVEEWFQTLAPIPSQVDRIHFHLVENRRDKKRPFAFLATYTTRIDAEGRVRHLPLKCALEEYHARQDKLLELLAAVNKVAKKNQVIASLLESGELFHPVALTPRDAFTFLNGVPDFEHAGILCRIPRWWRGGEKRKVAVGFAIGKKNPSRVGQEALLDFQASLHLGEEAISEEEARQLLEQTDGLALFRGQWVAVDTASLGQTLELLKKAKKIAEREQISFAEAMRLLMGTKTSAGSTLPEGTEITCGDWLKSVLEKMTNPAMVRATPPSPSLKADLRHYQQHGLNWLFFLHTLGFGICLADDMGLGKTVQVLALLQKVREEGRPSLVVAPASLLENWRREIEKFTPDLKTVLLHPQAGGGASLDELQHQICVYDVAITTYGMLSRLAWIGQQNWLYVICDEAQAIKNPATRQAKAVKALCCRHRLAMTGTPVENRLTDLWSLFDFINPGLLGSITEFKNYSKKLEEHPEGYGRLRRVIHPYILRRSKTDKAVIQDLPDKVEMKAYCPLSKVQAVLYQDLVERLEHDLAATDGIRRRGIILAYLMKFKQLCNHPDHYAGAGTFHPGKSGKFQRLSELCESIREKREKMLVFTQFREIIGPLAGFLERVFGSAGLTLDGSTSVKKRKEAIDYFHESRDYIPFFILSLKAGGVGLNLTGANHVIHFDRWWNPAVEDQATDRVYRIGQTKNVMVHKFVCRGTVEEKIDAMIDDKKKLAGALVSATAENWITELNDGQLRDLFRLTLAPEAGARD